MISEETFKITKYLISFGRHLRLVPFNWDEKRRVLKPLVSRQQYIIQQAVTLGQILLRGFLITYFGMTLQFMNLSVFESIMVVYLMGLFSGSTALLVILLIPAIHGELCKILNAALLFNKQHMKFHGMTSEQIQNDPIPKVTYTFLGLASIFTILVGPGTYYVLKRDWKLTWLAKVLYFPGSFELIGISASGFAVVEWSLFIFMYFCAVVYSMTINRWLARNICSGPETTEEKKESLRILCRAHFILNQILVDTMYYLMIGMFGLLLVLPITTLYMVVTMWAELDNGILACGTISAFIAYAGLAYLCYMGVQISDNSKAYRRSFERLDKYITLLDKKFFKSVRPIVFQVGPWIEIRPSTCPEVTDFIVSRVIDLILA